MNLITLLLIAGLVAIGVVAWLYRIAVDILREDASISASVEPEQYRYERGDDAA